ncbi:MAG TPA: hypothetical protein VGA67_05040 [Candidatus Dojkabacteria bacterium]|jgi:hypothetical protein
MSQIESIEGELSTTTGFELWGIEFMNLLKEFRLGNKEKPTMFNLKVGNIADQKGRQLILSYTFMQGKDNIIIASRNDVETIEGDLADLYNKTFLTPFFNFVQQFSSADSIDYSRLPATLLPPTLSDYEPAFTERFNQLREGIKSNGYNILVQQ